MNLVPLYEETSLVDEVTSKSDNLDATNGLGVYLYTWWSAKCNSTGVPNLPLSATPIGIST